MSRVFANPAALLEAVGTELGPTEWLTVDQDRIDGFAEVTGDDQWIHVDVERARTGPFGGTIAHGYLTLALVNWFLPRLMRVEQVSMGVNYGLERVRFPDYVPAGSRIRGRGLIVAAEPVKGGVQVTVRVTVEREGGGKPACVADTVSRFFNS